MKTPRTVRFTLVPVAWERDDMRLRRENEAELLFVGHSPLGPAISVVSCAGALLLAARVGGGVATTTEVAAALFGAASVLAVCHRDSLRFDRARRRWRRTRGLWPALRSTSGSYDSLRAVEVQEHPAVHRGEPRVEWEVWLRAEAPEARIRLAETPDPARAEAERARFARLLGLDAGRAA